MHLADAFMIYWPMFQIWWKPIKAVFSPLLSTNINFVKDTFLALWTQKWLFPQTSHVRFPYDDHGMISLSNRRENVKCKRRTTPVLELNII